MIIAVQGSKNFTDYQIFLRAMGTAMATVTPGYTEILIYSAGPSNVNAMCMEFSNVVERSMKGRGIKIKMQKAPIKWLKENINNVDYFIYLSKPKENLSDLATLAEKKDIEMGVYRY
jgi:protein-tyrosine-phosphatase